MKRAVFSIFVFMSFIAIVIAAEIIIPFASQKSKLDTFVSSLDEFAPKYIITNNEYLPFECKLVSGKLKCNDTNNFGITAPINKDEYTIIGGINSYMHTTSEYWTMSEINSNAYYIEKTGLKDKSKTLNSGLRSSVYVQKNAKVSGTGTVTNPFKFVGNAGNINITVEDAGTTYKKLVVRAVAVDDISEINHTTYQFSKDNGVTWTVPSVVNPYVFEDATPNTEYQVKAKVQNMEGITGESETLIIRTPALSGPTITNVTGNPTIWTRNNVQLTVSAVSEDTLLYSFDGGLSYQSSNVSPIYSSNQSVKVMVKDTFGNTAEVTVNITKIDKTPPVLTLNGENPTYAWQSAAYTDAGARMTDNSEATKTISAISGTVNTSVVGTYTLTYRYTDQAGNVSNTLTRTVVVRTNVLTYDYTGSVQTTTLGPGTYTFELWGAQGGNTGYTAGGTGGYAKGQITFTSNQTLNIYVGGQGGKPTAGWNGGAVGGSSLIASSIGSGGGGASDIRIGGSALQNRAIVAGGGGGAGGLAYSLAYEPTDDGRPGGAAGYAGSGYGNYSMYIPPTASGVYCYVTVPNPYPLVSFGGGAGTTAGGGAGGTVTLYNSSVYGVTSNPCAWSLRYPITTSAGAGGGGGGGYYGGGGGASTASVYGYPAYDISLQTATGGSAGSLGTGGSGGLASAVHSGGSQGGAGGGGGSSWINTSLFTSTSISTGRTGNGHVRITKIG